jgi:glycosyltransferase involved in cell wall biosynthesis
LQSQTDLNQKLVIDVIIPVFNEEESISLVINDIPKNLVRNIYVCDNGSTDLSKERAARAGATVLEESHKGYGSACLKGIKHIESLGPSNFPELVIFIDGDYSDRPVEMHSLIDEIISKDLDLVIGSRVQGRAESGSLGIVQEFGNKLSTFLISLLFNYRYTDLGPFRVIRFSKLLEMKMEDPDYGWTVEMQIKAAKMKMRVGEVPVSYFKRIGKSKISGTLKGVIGAASKILYMIFKSFVKG